MPNPTSHSWGQIGSGALRSVHQIFCGQMYHYYRLLHSRSLTRAFYHTLRGWLVCSKMTHVFVLGSMSQYKSQMRILVRMYIFSRQLLSFLKIKIWSSPRVRLVPPLNKVHGGESLKFSDVLATWIHRVPNKTVVSVACKTPRAETINHHDINGATPFQWNLGK